MFESLRSRFLYGVAGWITYKKQSVALAGFALALLYTNILDFAAVTASYIHSTGFKDLYLSVAFGLGKIFRGKYKV